MIKLVSDLWPKQNVSNKVNFNKEMKLFSKINQDKGKQG
jgi:hypothetical protein